MEYETSYRVLYADTDQMGYLYHGNYAKLYEIGRTEMIRDLGLTYAGMEREHGTMMPVMSLNQRFVRPARYDEVLTIRVTLRRLPERTMTFHVEILNEAGKLCNGGSVKLAFIDAVTHRGRTCPTYLIEQLRPHLED